MPVLELSRPQAVRSHRQPLDSHCRLQCGRGGLDELRP
jgi:hypothetical protein